MKRYIIFGNIVGIGGWQIYVDAKVAFLKELGWEVHVFSPKRTWMRELIKLEGLKPYEKNSMFELCYSPYNLSISQQEDVIDKIIDTFSSVPSNDDYILIESTSIPSSFWGEILAQKLKSKHFVYLLHSYFNPMPNSYIEYFNFKHKRKELAGMAEDTLPNLFNGYKKISENDNYFFTAAGKNPITSSTEYDSFISRISSKIRDCDYIIGAFGTLNKPHALKIFGEIINFSERYSDKKLAYIVIGSSINGIIEDTMKKIAKNKKNLQLILVEEMYPVPDKLFKLMDVCIGSWGSAMVSAIAGAKTIRLNSDTGIIPQELVGYQTFNNPNETTSKCSLYQLIEEVLTTNKYNDLIYTEQSPYPDFREEHMKCINFALSGSTEREYYNIALIKSPNKKQTIKRNIIKLLGVNRADKLFNILRR